MGSDLTDFWRGYQSGFEVAVASSSPDLLLGVRDGFRRYLHLGLDLKVPIAVHAEPSEEPASGLPMGDQATLSLARSQARGLETRHRGRYQFYVAVVGGLEAVEVDGDNRFLIRSWAVVLSALGEAWGSSGAVEIPSEILTGPPSYRFGPKGFGTRRQGGITSALTVGLESRRQAAALSSFHALSTLFYGTVQGKPSVARQQRAGV